MNFIMSDSFKILMPMLAIIILPLCGLLWAEMSQDIDKKASQESVDNLCKTVDGKVDNKTLQMMIQKNDSEHAQMREERREQKVVNEKLIDTLTQLQIQMAKQNPD